MESSDADSREWPAGCWLIGKDVDCSFEADRMPPSVVLNVSPTSGSEGRDAGGLTDVSLDGLDDAMEDWDGEGEETFSWSEKGSAGSTV